MAKGQCVGASMLCCMAVGIALLFASAVGGNFPVCPTTVAGKCCQVIGTCDSSRGVQGDECCNSRAESFVMFAFSRRLITGGDAQYGCYNGNCLLAWSSGIPCSMDTSGCDVCAPVFGQGVRSCSYSSEWTSYGCYVIDSECRNDQDCANVVPLSVSQLQTPYSMRCAV